MGRKLKQLRYTTAPKPVVGWVDSSFGDTLNDVKRKLEAIGVSHPSDRQASAVIAKMFGEIDFDIKRKNKKRRGKFEITFE